MKRKNVWWVDLFEDQEVRGKLLEEIVKKGQSDCDDIKTVFYTMKEASMETSIKIGSMQ